MSPSRTSLARRLTALAVLLGVLVGAAPSGPRTATDTDRDVYYVAPGGRDTSLPDCDGGTEREPFGTLTFAFACLTPGDRLHVRGGRYHERVLTPVNRGYASAPIVVKAYPGERPVVVGLVRLEVADWWTVEGLNVTSDTRTYGSGEYLVKMRGGVGWTWRDSEIWDARSYAAFRVESSPKGALDRWRIEGNCIHDTWPTHGTNEDHNVYVDTGWGAGQGTITRNLIFDAPNGTNVKLGPGADPASAAVRVVLKYNTLWNGVQNVLANGRSNNLRLERNIFGHVIRRKSWYPHVRGFDLDGGDNVVLKNVGTGGARMIANDSGSSRGWRDRGGNRSAVDPRFDRVSSCTGFRPGTLAAFTYGRWAPPRPRPRATALACPSGDVPPATFRDVPRPSSHVGSIDCAVWRGVASGVTPFLYRPDHAVTRGQMATFLTRLITRSGGTLPLDPPDAFRDDDGHPHEQAIDRLAAAGLIGGVGDGRVAPDAPVTRSQMATFLIRAYEQRTGETLAKGPDYFGDDSGDLHQGSINIATLAGFTGGIAEGRYGPTVRVSRAQMATFIARVYDKVIATL